MEMCELLAEQPGMGRKRDDLRLGLQSFGVKDYLIFYRVRSYAVDEVLSELNRTRGCNPLNPTTMLNFAAQLRNS
jgi:hypothetical protein